MAQRRPRGRARSTSDKPASPASAPPPATEQSTFPRANAGVSVALFLLCILIWNSNLRPTGSFDSLAASFMPFSLLRGDGVRLDRYAEGPRTVYYSIVKSPKTGEWVSAYPIVTPLLATPLFLPTLFFDELRPDHPRWGGAVRVLFEKLAASVIAGLAVVFFYLAMRRHRSQRVAAGLALLLAFATSLWSLSSQSLWPHGAAQLLLAIALWLFARGELTPRALVVLGVVAGLLTANRPQDLFWSAALALVVLLRAGKRSWPFWIAAASIAVLLGVYNLHYFTSLQGAYGDWASFGYPEIPFHRPTLQSLAGLLVSTRGLLFASPFLVWTVCSWWRRDSVNGLPKSEILVWSLCFVGFWVFHAAYPYWGGGYSYGPRYMSDPLPVLLAACAPALVAVRRTWERLLLALAVGWALLFQVIGAFSYPTGDSGSETHGVWSLGRSSVAVAAAHGPAAPHYLSPLLPKGWYLDRMIDVERRTGRLTWIEPAPERVETLEVVRLRVSAEVGQGAAWTSLGSLLGGHGVRWRADWRRLDGQFSTGADAWLGLHVAPGERTEKTLRLVAPLHPGRYRLSIEPAQFGFSEWVGLTGAGSGPLTADVDVSAPPG